MSECCSIYFKYILYRFQIPFKYIEQRNSPGRSYCRKQRIMETKDKERWLTSKYSWYTMSAWLRLAIDIRRERTRMNFCHFIDCNIRRSKKQNKTKKNKKKQNNKKQNKKQNKRIKVKQNKAKRKTEKYSPVRFLLSGISIYGTLIRIISEFVSS